MGFDLIRLAYKKRLGHRNTEWHVKTLEEMNIY